MILVAFSKFVHSETVPQVGLNEAAARQWKALDLHALSRSSRSRPAAAFELPPTPTGARVIAPDASGRRKGLRCVPRFGIRDPLRRALSQAGADHARGQLARLFRTHVAEVHSLGRGPQPVQESGSLGRG